MATSVPTPSESDSFQRIAPVFHTFSLLLMLAVWALWSKMQVDQMRDVPNPDRIGLYVRTLAFEWFLLLFVILGLWLSDTPLCVALGERWHSFREMLRDIGIAAAFWCSSFTLLIVFGFLLRITNKDHDIRFLLPHGRLEIALWIALSISAGICEEAIFRGYLQQQFLSFTKKVPTAIFLSAAVFGAGHIYQGPRRAILIGLYGAMFSILAYWRKSLRPGMLAHATQDTLSGLLASILHH